MKKWRAKLIEYGCEILSLYSTTKKLQRIIFEDDMQMADYRNSIRNLKTAKHNLLNEIAELKQQIEVRDKRIEFMQGGVDEG